MPALTCLHLEHCGVLPPSMLQVQQGGQVLPQVREGDQAQAGLPVPEGLPVPAQQPAPDVMSVEPPMHMTAAATATATAMDPAPSSLSPPAPDAVATATSSSPPTSPLTGAPSSLRELRLINCLGAEFLDLSACTGLRVLHLHCHELGSASLLAGLPGMRLRACRLLRELYLGLPGYAPGPLLQGGGGLAAAASDAVVALGPPCLKVLACASNELAVMTRNEVQGSRGVQPPQIAA